MRTFFRIQTLWARLGVLPFDLEHLKKYVCFVINVKKQPKM